MRKNPREYPDTMSSAESGRPMTRGDKAVTLKVDGKSYTYMQPGWWCSLDDPNDDEGQLVDDDNKVAEMARRTAAALASGESVFVPVVIRAIRENLGLTQREAGVLFGAGDKSFEKYESGEITPSEPTRRLLRLAMNRPDLFRPPAAGSLVLPSDNDARLVRETLSKASVERIYERLFEALKV